MKTRAIPFVLAALLTSTAARAQEVPQPPSPQPDATPPVDAKPKGAVCSESYQQAQITRREGKSALLTAREAARTCLSSSCQGWMTADCSQWLSELDARIPTLVFTAKNTAERDLVDVAVSTVDGQALTSRLEGHSIEFEPGQHTFVFVTKEGARLEKQVIVREGAKAQVVTAVFEAPAEELAALQRAKRVDAPPPPPPEQPNVLRYVGFGGMGLGAIALGIGTGFGISALVRKNDLTCDAQGRCDDGGALSSGKTTADVSTVAFITGGVLAAGGLALVLWSKPHSRMAAQPSLGPTHAGLQLGGHF